MDDVRINMFTYQDRHYRPLGNSGLRMQNHSLRTEMSYMLIHLGDYCSSLKYKMINSINNLWLLPLRNVLKFVLFNDDSQYILGQYFIRNNWDSLTGIDRTRTTYIFYFLFFFSFFFHGDKIHR